MEDEADVTITQPLLPNLLILGAAKSGTSSLYSYLAQHPDVLMSRFKEPTFFVWEGREYDMRGRGPERAVINDLDSYLALFSEARNERVRGEASSGYLHTPGAAERIREHVPEARLMAILRNPVDRAYSAFLHARASGFEPLADFEQALDEEPHRIDTRWIGLTLYATVGMYAEQLERYLAVFPCEQIRVYLFDDLVRDPIRIAQDAFRWVGVSDSFEPDVSKRTNRGVAVRSVRLYNLLKSLRKTSLGRRLVLGTSARAFAQMISQRPKGQLSPNLRHRLASVFEDDIMRLSRLLDRDVSPWLEGREVPRMRSTTELGVHPCG